MKKSSYILLSTAMTLFFGAYLSAALLHSDLIGDIISPFIGLLSGGVLLYTYRCVRHDRSTPSIWLLYGIGCLIWALCDVIWGVMELSLGMEPAYSMLLSAFYTLTNLCFLIAVLIYSADKFQKWHRIKLTLDVVTITFAWVYLLWVLIFRRSYGHILTLLVEQPIVLLSVLMDIGVFVAVAIWYLSIRSEHVTGYHRLMSIGLLLFASNDLYYNYTYINDRYTPNSLTDVLYMVALLQIAASGLRELYWQEGARVVEMKDHARHPGLLHKGALILIFPLLMALDGSLTLEDLLVFVLLLAIYEWFGAYINHAIKNEQLLEQELHNNAVLEQYVAARTRELAENNRQLEEINQELDFLANQDYLTTLHNDRYLIRTLHACIEHLTPQETVVLLNLDIDRFKAINDTHGHATGDRVLQEVALRLQARYGEHATVSRMGGDEFALVFIGAYDYETALQLGEALLALCGEKICFDGYVFNITLSCGISIYPHDAQTVAEMQKNAEIAMFRAKVSSSQKCLAFDVFSNKDIQRRYALEYLLRNADLDHEFELFYQPQFSIPDRRLIGAEALIRWNSPNNGYIMPGEFIPVAEEINMISELGTWILREAVQQSQRWNTAYGQNLKIGINISPKQLASSSFASDFRAIIEQYLPCTDWVDAEITEGIAIGGQGDMSKLALFQSLGISVSIDDFGTGYSSLSYLKHFPFDRIKIAKELIDNIATDAFDRQIVQSIIALAQAIGAQTIAEGVETQEQLDILISLGCGEIQGYLFGRPVPAPVFEKTFLQTLPKEEH